MNRLKFLFLFASYAIFLIGLLIYSFSQVDLNLTISSNIYYQVFQEYLLDLGYFNRPLSTAFYVVIILFLFIFYLLILHLVRYLRITKVQIIYLLIVGIVILFLSYPAFSYDIYNYMFDARIITKYLQNPYIHKALDFPADPWIRFMHWTHRTYPYGPIWLLVTLPVSFLGFGKFVLTLINFKLMFLLFYLGNIFLIGKILGKTSPQNRLLGVSLYAFNPVILLESLVSPHNESAMLFFLLLAIYMGIVRKSSFWWIGGLLLSGGIKFISLILIPLKYFYGKNIILENKYATFLKVCLLLLTLLVVFQIYQRDPYPWYFITLIGLASLLPFNFKTRLLLYGVTFGALLYYIPYLYIGYYPSYVRTAQTAMFLVPIVSAIIWLLIVFIKGKLKFVKVFSKNK